MEIEDLFDYNEDLFDDQEGEEENLFDDQDEINTGVISTEYLDEFPLYFNCSGTETSVNNDRLFKDLQSILQNKNFKFRSYEIDLYNFSFDLDDPPMEILIQMTRKNIHKLATTTNDEFYNSSNVFLSIREDITKFLLCLRCQDEISENHLKILRVALGTFDSMSIFSSIQSAVSRDGNLSKQSSYHLLHGQLEWRWIYLTIIYKLEKMKGSIHSHFDESNFQKEIFLLIFDLVSLSISKFNKCNNATIIFSSPIICSCVKELWLVIFEFIERLQNDSLNFWNIISQILDNFHDNKNPHENFQDYKILLKTSSGVKCRNFDQFAIWFMCGVVNIIPTNYNEDQSYEILQNYLKNYLKTEQSEESFRVLLVILSDVISDRWNTKTDILLHIWENFHKKINSAFFIAGQMPSASLAVSTLSAMGYLEKIKTTQKSMTKLNPNSTSYDMFVFLLGKQIENLTSLNQRIQIQKILGRIYTKFPTTKLQTLNEMGIVNVLKLFLTLSISTNFHDVAKKFSDILLQIPMEKSNNQQQIVKGHMALLILYRENQIEISSYVEKLMNLLNSLIEKSGSGLQSVLKIIADALPIIVSSSSSSEDENFENGEDLLIDLWIERYLQGGTISEQDRVFESLSKIIKRLRDSKSSIPTSNMVKLMQKLFTILLPFCKLNFGKSESSMLPVFVGNLCLLANDFPEASTQKFENLFKTFLELNNGNNIEHVIKYLSIIVENSSKIKQLDRVLVMQHWIKCSVLLSGSNSNIKELTRLVIKLDEFKFLSETARNNPEEVINSKEPICVLLADVGKKYSTSNNHDLKFNLIDKLHSYLLTFDKWAIPIYQQQQINSSIQQQQRSITADESLMRIYTFISVTILHCAELVYIRSKSNCFFNIAISQFLLPPTLMMGQQQPRSIIISMFKVWPLLIDGVARLNYQVDQHISKVLNDLIVKWTPLMKISNNSKAVAKPFISLTNLKNPEVTEFAYGKLAKNFISLQNRKPNQHACLILTMMEEVLHVIEGEETKLMLVWRGSMIHIVEAAMLTDDNAPSQLMCYKLLERFVKNRNFETSSQMKELLVKSIQEITQQNLSYYSAFYFRFMTKLCKFAPKIVSSQLNFISSQIKKCEQLRGSGTDVKLRNLFSQLESYVMSKK